MPGKLKSNDFTWIGGALCLDFSNTMISRPTSSPRDKLESYGDLVEWAELAGLIAKKQKTALQTQAMKRPRLARQTLTEARELREAIHRIFARKAEGKKPAPKDLKALNAAATESMGHQTIVASGEGFDWQWDADGRRLDCLLWPLVQSAVELLVSKDLSHVRQCALATCSAMFLDLSKNKRRRWCDMKECGNRAKAREHYRRKSAGK